MKQFQEYLEEVTSRFPSNETFRKWNTAMAIGVAGLELYENLPEFKKAFKELKTTLRESKNTLFKKYSKPAIDFLVINSGPTGTEDYRDKRGLGEIAFDVAIKHALRDKAEFKKEYEKDASDPEILKNMGY